MMSEKEADAAILRFRRDVDRAVLRLLRQSAIDELEWARSLIWEPEGYGSRHEKIDDAICQKIQKLRESNATG
jgi:hypothetical protein